jgi:hypothetical protein
MWYPSHNGFGCSALAFLGCTSGFAMLLDWATDLDCVPTLYTGAGCLCFSLLNNKQPCCICRES